MLNFGFSFGKTILKDYENLAPNSVWAGMSGSDSTADFVPPTGYSRFQDTAHMEAVDVGEGHLGFKVEGSSQRSMIILTMTTLEIGERYNLSIFHDTVVQLSGGRVATAQQGANMIRQMDRPADGTQGRIDAVFEATETNVQFRFGLGLTTNASGEYTLSRLQITKGESLLPYKPTT